MKSPRLLLSLALAVIALALPASAQASFGFLSGAEGFDASLTQADGSPATKAGSHPYAMHLHLAFNKAGSFTDGDPRDLSLTLPAGLLLNSSAVGECSQVLFHTHRKSPYQESLSGESCPDASQVGVIAVHSSISGGLTRTFGLFNLAAPYGSSEAIGASPFGVPLELSAKIREPDAAFVFGGRNLSQAFGIQSTDLTLWGTPTGSPTPRKLVSETHEGSKTTSVFEEVFEHDNERGNCLNEEDPSKHFGTPGRIVTTEKEESPKPAEAQAVYAAGTCSVPPSPLLEPPKSYLSLPTSCGQPLPFEVSATSWQERGTIERTALDHDSEGHPVTLNNCIEPLTIGKVQLRTDKAASATGVVFNLDVNDGGGLLNSSGVVRSQIQRMSVSLPEGLTINPSLGAGLGVCTEADFAREAVDTPPGQGCPNDSKIGDTEIEGLIGLSEPISGSVYLAKPYLNPQHALIALYITISSPRRGIFEKAAGKVVPDHHTGRLDTTFEGLPKLHYTHFGLSLREGQRAALISPAVCGPYRADIAMTPWSDPNLIVPDFSNFFIDSGEGGGPCPTGALRPFSPGLEAGSINPQAGAYTPFFLHMTRTDAEQEITSYSATFPPGLTGKLAGVTTCPDQDIEAAKLRTGTEELEAPSCPASSSIGHTLAGYGVGGVLAYAPGALYLAGPYHGAPLSTVAIDSALVGPFDLGVVVVRSAIRIDPQTARPSIDSSGSDPIPHILEGIPIHLRDIRVYVDRPNFTLNPTNCDPLESLSTLTGAGQDVFSTQDDVPATSHDRYQAFNCGALGFSPRFKMKLKGTTHRGGFPSLRATYEPLPGNSNAAGAQVTLPHTEFLAQGHIREICTQKLFATEACPASSIYGSAKAESPLLAEALEGPVYLRSNGGTGALPDLVAALKGANGIRIDIVGHISSTKVGGMRSSFEVLPDAPATKFTLTLQGGKKGLLENSANLCAEPSYAKARFIAQDNSTEAMNVKMANDCKAKGKRKGKRRR
jgi:hypothetical protein